jgi:hypothetical protein
MRCAAWKTLLAHVVRLSLKSDGASRSLRHFHSIYPEYQMGQGKVDISWILFLSIYQADGGKTSLLGA